MTVAQSVLSTTDSRAGKGRVTQEASSQFPYVDMGPHLVLLPLAGKQLCSSKTPSR